MNSPRVRVGVIGTGTFAIEGHISKLQALPHAEVVAVCGRSQDRAHAIAKQFRIPSVFSDYRELCAKADIEAVTIVTANVLHAEQAMIAFQHGKHVLCEKPLARTLSEAQAMLDLALASKKIHHVNFPYRYLYGVRELRRRVRAGDIGDPYLLRVQYDGWKGLDPEWRIGWRERQEVAGGGELYDRGSHLFDIARFLFGRIDQVTGFVHRIPRKRVDASTNRTASVETDDIAAAWFRHESRIRGQLFVSRATPRSGENGWLEVSGTKGALRASLSRGQIDRLEFCPSAETSWHPVPLPAAADDGQPHCLTASMGAFIDACIKGQSNPDVDASFIDGVAAQQALDAVLRANEEFIWVHLSDVSKSSDPRPARPVPALPRHVVSEDHYRADAGTSASSTAAPTFSSVDTNNDGQISRSEWDAHFKK
jgi:predicted dehydrogenase